MSEPESFKYYHYDPSLAAACVFAIVFGSSTVWHSILIAKHRTWYFIPLLIGGICMYFCSFFVFDFRVTRLIPSSNFC